MAAPLAWKIAKQLCAPLNYLRAKHPSKVHYDWTIPLAVATLATLLFAMLPIRVNVFGEHGLVANGNGLLQILTGFYIAALAAVSTFNSSVIEGKFVGVDVTLDERIGDEPVKSPLNRRRFLSLLFGYLAFVSLGVYLFGSLAIGVAAGLSTIVHPPIHVWIKFGFLFAYLAITMNMLTTTLLGLYYLSYRLHVPVRMHKGVVPRTDSRTAPDTMDDLADD